MPDSTEHFLIDSSSTFSPRPFRSSKRVLTSSQTGSNASRHPAPTPPARYDPAGLFTSRSKREAEDTCETAGRFSTPTPRSRAALPAAFSRAFFRLTFGNQGIPATERVSLQFRLDFANVPRRTSLCTVVECAYTALSRNDLDLRFPWKRAVARELNYIHVV